MLRILLLSDIHFIHCEDDENIYRSTSVIHCGTSKDEILAGLDKIFSPKIRQMAQQSSNPYEKEGTAQHIFEVIKNYPLHNITQKHFYDINQ